MSFNDFWNTSKRANDFLRTGVTNDTVRGRNDTFTIRDKTTRTRTGPSSFDPSDNLGCHSSTQCPSGHACVNGVCQFMNKGANQQQPSPGTGGDCDPNDPESPCNSGAPGACQPTPTCGDLETEARDCCGKRCCSFGSASSSRPGVHCWCGDCPPWPGCTSFCDSYLKANGKVGPGCTEGRAGNSCDSCTECDGNVGGECKERFIGAPCWCAHETECNNRSPGFHTSHQGCLECNTQLDSDDFGDCVYVGDDKCQDCATLSNHLCPCGIILSDITVCKVRSEGGLLPINEAQRIAAERCAELCPKADPCEPKPALKVKRCCFEDYGDCTFPSCEPGQKELAYEVDALGYGCVTCEVAPPSVPDSCCVPECNCHDDCGPCEECNSEGKCQRADDCEFGKAGWWRWNGTVNGASAKSGWYNRTQQHIDNGGYLSIYAAFSLAQQTNFSADYFGVSVGTAWFAGPLEITKKNSLSCEFLIGAPQVWEGADGNVSSSAGGFIGYDPNLGTFIPEIPNCDSEPGYAALFEGGWEYGGDGAEAPPF